MADETSKDASEDAKARFREALDRKKQGHAARPAVPGTSGTVNAAHGKVGGKREFRRKSS